MSKLVPKSRPQKSRNEIEAILRENDLSISKEKLILVGVRGYYKSTFGKPFENDRNFYDDAMFLITENSFASFNCNVDPSKFRKGIATLTAGKYRVRQHKHKGKYAALQIVRDTVTRDQETGTDTGTHGINFHYGGDNDTWSEGCQTFPQSQYWQFQGLVYELMKELNLSEIEYLLIEN